MDTFKVIVAGGRDFSDFLLLERKLDHLLQNKTNIEIVSGGAMGADRLGERYAKERGYKLEIMKANWDDYGRSAGPRRNEDMARYAEACVCFWDGVSSGTKNMIVTARRHQLKLAIVPY